MADRLAIILGRIIRSFKLSAKIPSFYRAACNADAVLW